MINEMQDQECSKRDRWYRLYGEFINACIPISGVVFILHLPSHLGWSIYVQQYFGFVFGLIIASAFIGVSAKSQKRTGAVPWYDLLCSVVALIIGVYLFVNYRVIALESGLSAPELAVLGGISILLILEASRRVVGWAFVVIVLCFILYALFSSYIPGILGMRSTPPDMLFSYLFIDPQGILGVPLKVSVTIVLVFILFGQALTAIGGGEVFMDIAFSLMGKYRGGPAKVAILSSSLFGSISGSAVANVVTTGVLTIPLMKKAGYRAYFAGAVEAVASTGGQIVPPIMGAAAFLMASFLGVPYSEVAIAAIIPALLYYVAVFIQVDLRARRRGLIGLPPDQLPSLPTVLKKGWIFLFPFASLILLLFAFKMEPEFSGLIATAISLVIGCLYKSRSNMSPAKIWEILAATGKTLLEVGVTSAGAGIIIGILSLTGLGFIFSNVLVSLALGNTLLLLVMAAIGSIVLGMGMTVTAAYLLVVVLIAPALVEIGISEMLAHFFVFYFAVLSFLTPPVCLAGYAAASIAGAKMVKTAVQGMRLGVAAYIVPFIFAYHPALLLQGAFVDIVIAVAGGLIGIALLAVALEGYLFEELTLPTRMCFVAASILFMVPGVYVSLAGAAVAVPLIVISRRRRQEFG